MSKNDYYGAHHDAITEMADYCELQRHEVKECAGPGNCDYCKLDDDAIAEQQLLEYQKYLESENRRALVAIFRGILRGIND